MTALATTSGDALDQLRAAVDGDVLRPDDAGYQAAIATFNLTVRHRPALVVVAAGTADVVAAVRFASAHDLPVAIQATGHAGQPADGALLINTSRMVDVTVDPGRRTARVERTDRAHRGRPAPPEPAGQPGPPTPGGAPRGGRVERQWRLRWRGREPVARADPRSDVVVPGRSQPWTA